MPTTTTTSNLSTGPPSPTLDTSEIWAQPPRTLFLPLRILQTILCLFAPSTFLHSLIHHINNPNLNTPPTTNPPTISINGPFFFDSTPYNLTHSGPLPGINWAPILLTTISIPLLLWSLTNECLLPSHSPHKLKLRPSFILLFATTEILFSITAFVLGVLGIQQTADENCEYLVIPPGTKVTGGRAQMQEWKGRMRQVLFFNEGEQMRCLAWKAVPSVTIGLGVTVLLTGLILGKVWRDRLRLRRDGRGGEEDLDERARFKVRQMLSVDEEAGEKEGGLGGSLGGFKGGDGAVGLDCEKRLDGASEGKAGVEGKQAMEEMDKKVRKWEK